ncbi:MBL fold metallo-hydrolase [Micromonospora sp. CPCC 206060]|uniref:MBL fold metallo-hydrolase n=1 Tax=Micromonospora sp. CPCC 206060 TaxID=3122406 RepID=UPI002FF32318
MTGYTRGLHEVADRVWAWLLPDGGWGWSNAGLIGGDGESFLVDTLFDLPLTAEMLDAMRVITATSPVRGALNTHANGDHCFGNQLLGADVAIHATSETVHEMRHGSTPERLRSLVEADLGPILSPFLRDCFGPFDFEGIAMRGPDVTFETRVSVDVGGRRVELLRLGPAHTSGDAIAHVPDCGVLFAGDLLFIGRTPIMWADSLDDWIEACDRMIRLEPEIVVPGHGPVSDVDGILSARAYLAHVKSEVEKSLHAGHSWREAADRMDLGPFATLPQAERVVVTTYHAYRRARPETPQVESIDLFGSMAEWKLRRCGTPS